MIKKINRWTEKAAFGFNGGAALCVVVMMLLTCADVFLRLFRMPIIGTYEMVGFLGALFVGFSLAHTSVMKGHIAVSFLVQRLSSGVRDAIMLINDLVAFALFALATRQCMVYAESLKAAGEVSMTLQMPVYLIVRGIGIGCGLLAVVLFVRFLKSGNDMLFKRKRTAG